MVQAQVANLASENDKLLLVEGRDDWHSLRNIFLQATNRETIFDIGYCGNAAEVLAMLSSVVVGSGTTKSVLGAVIDADADTGVDARFQSIRNALQSAYDFPDNFPTDGLIVHPKESRPDRHRLPTIGVWLMPDNVRPGIFEDLLCTAMTTGSEQYIANVVDQAKIDGKAGFRDVERSKAIVKTHMVWQDPNKKNLGEAIGTHFENLSPAFQPFMEWLNHLFGETAQ